jgi:hypothetical protein
MNKLKDTDLREALRRKYANTPQLPNDFMDSVMKRMEAEPKPARKVRLWRWVAAAACLLLMIGIGAGYEFRRICNSTAVNSEFEIRNSSLSNCKFDRTAKETPVQQACTDSTKALYAQYKGSVLPVQKARTERKTPVQQSEAAVEEAIPVPVRDPNLHYAAQIQTEDTVAYQAPSRMEEFIAKLAEYNKVKGVPLNCTSDMGPDSTIVCTAYVFEDKEEYDLFARLLQAACWYDSNTPGYLLSYSHQQFFFTLKDLRKGNKYLWIAERLVGERILLFSTHSPIETTVSSVCYQNYREQLTHTNISTLNF